MIGCFSECCSRNGFRRTRKLPGKVGYELKHDAALEDNALQNLLFPQLQARVRHATNGIADRIGVSGPGKFQEGVRRDVAFQNVTDGFRHNLIELRLVSFF